MRVAVFLALAAGIVYVGSMRTIQTVDTNTNVLFAYSLVRERDIDLDEHRGDFGALSYWSYDIGGREISPYPPGAGLLAAPFAAAGTALGIVPPAAASATAIGKLAAAAAVAASVAFVYLAAARLTSSRRAAAVAGLYAFGTASWPISAGALWQHGPAQLWLACGLLWLMPAQARWLAAAAGLAFALATLTRLSDAAFLLGALAFLALHRRADLPRFALGAAAPLAALALYQAAAFGSPFDLRYPTTTLATAAGPAEIALALVGAFISPNRGILVFSPFLAIGLVALGRTIVGADPTGGMLRWQTLAAAAVLGAYSTADWAGGYGYGDRYLADALPLLALGLALALRDADRRTFAFISGSGAFAIVIAAAGALFYDWQAWSWEAAAPDALTPWRIDPPQWWYALSRAPASLDLIGIVSLALVAAGLVLFAVGASSARNAGSGGA